LRRSGGSKRAIPTIGTYYSLLFCCATFLLLPPLLAKDKDCHRRPPEQQYRPIGGVVALRPSICIALRLSIYPASIVFVITI